TKHGTVGHSATCRTSVIACRWLKPARIVDELGVNQRHAMTEVRHVAECPTVPCFVLTWMKTFPVTRKFPALRRELCPARSSIERIYFLVVTAAVVIEHKVCVHL